MSGKVLRTDVTNSISFTAFEISKTEAIRNHKASESSEFLIKPAMSKSMVKDCHGVFKSSIIRPLKKHNATLFSSL